MNLAPDWAALVAEAAGRPAVTRPPDGEPGDWLGRLARPFAGVVAAAGDRLPGVDGAIVDRGPVRARFEERLGRDLARLALRALVAELHRARAAGTLTGADPTARFADFVRRTARPDELARLFSRYPVLARLVGTAAVLAAESWAELLHRFAADRPALVRSLFGGTDPGRLVDIDPALGDPHRGGRSVARLHFASGLCVVYKPRPLSPHARFAVLVDWLNGRVPGLGLSTVPVLVQDGYGWLAHVEHRPNRTVRGVARFYRRLGALTALLYAIDATDIHYENLIADADQPLLVDLETIFHPELPPPTVVDDPAARALGASVHRLLLLPHELAGPEGVLDVSGLGGDRGAYPNPVVGWAEPGTDRMRLIRERGEFTGAANRPRLGGVGVDAVDHERALLNGFRAGYGAIVRYRADFADLVAAAADDEIRILVRPTWLYSRLLAETTHPDVLGDRRDRDRVFDHLRVAGTADPVRERLLEDELADLWRGDIPCFLGRPGSRDVEATGGVRVPDLLAAAPLDGVREKLAALGTADRRRQEWVITATLAIRRQRRAGGPAARTPGRALGPRRALAAARSVGDDLLGWAIRQGDAVNWWGLRADGPEWTVAPLGAGLFDGYGGVALFLAQLAREVDEPRYAETARLAVRQLPRLLDAFDGRDHLVAAVGCDGYDGFGGIAYAAARLGTLLDEPALYVAAATAVTLAARSGGDRVSCRTAMRAVYAETGLPAAAALARRPTGPAQPRPGTSRRPPRGVTTPDLRYGLAGIGYALLRTARRVPSVRALEPTRPPRRTRERDSRSATA